MIGSPTSPSFSRAILREEDILPRTGGDEFTLVLADGDVEVAVALVRRLLDHPLADVACTPGLAAWGGPEAAGGLILRAYPARDRAEAVHEAVVLATGTEPRGTGLHAPT